MRPHGDERPHYVIGDVHGRLDLLEAILAFVLNDARTLGRRPRVTFLGDIVDRGPDSRGCLDLVGRTLGSFPGSRLMIGNHDRDFLHALRGGSRKALESWLGRGGNVTIESYERSGAGGTASTSLSRHLDMIESAPFLAREGGLVLAHAGIDPRLRLSDQSVDDCVRIRNGFLDHAGPIRRPVIHGHTVVGGTPMVTENRISIDTGAYRTGRLTVAVLDPARRSLRFHQTDGSPARVTEIAPRLLDRGFGTVLDTLEQVFSSTKPTREWCANPRRREATRARTPASFPPELVSNRWRDSSSSDRNLTIAAAAESFDPSPLHRSCVP